MKKRGNKYPTDNSNEEFYYACICDLLNGHSNLEEWMNTQRYVVMFESYISTSPLLLCATLSAPLSSIRVFNTYLNQSFNRNEGADCLI